MLLNNRLITAAFSVLLFTSYAQQDKLVTHFMFDKMSINPGKTGIDMYNGICATSIYRNQWDKVNGAPNSTVLNIESNLSRFFPGGVGINFYNDAIGFARQNTVLLNYSYPIQIGRIGVLGVGVGMGIMNYLLKLAAQPGTPRARTKGDHRPRWQEPRDGRRMACPEGWSVLAWSVRGGHRYCQRVRLD